MSGEGTAASTGDSTASSSLLQLRTSRVAERVRSAAFTNHQAQSAALPVHERRARAEPPLPGSHPSASASAKPRAGAPMSWPVRRQTGSEPGWSECLTRLWKRGRPTFPAEAWTGCWALSDSKRCGRAPPLVSGDGDGCVCRPSPQLAYLRAPPGVSPGAPHARRQLRLVDTRLRPTLDDHLC